MPPLYAKAVAQAKTALGAQIAPIQDEQASSDASFQQQETDSANVAAALSKLLQPIGPAVNSEYQTAAQNQELAGAGFSHGMQDALQGNTDNLNATLDKLGSPAQITSTASDAADGVYAGGGFNPGVMFSKQGANLGAAATVQSGDAILGGQQNAKALQSQAIVADQGFQAKIAELAGALPGDIQTNYDKLQTISLNDAKFAQTVKQNNIADTIKTADVKLAQAKYSTGISEFNSKQSLNYAKLANSEMNQNRNYQLALARVGIARQKEQQTTTALAFKAANGGLTKVQVNKYMGLANAIANAAWHGTASNTSTAKTSATSTTPVKTASSVIRDANTPYFQALGDMMKKGVPVQMAMDSLDRVYPQAARPTPNAILLTLGPLAPQALQNAVVNGALSPGYSAQDAAGLAMTDPVGLLEQASPAVKPLKAAAFHLATSYGWGDTANLNALNALWTRESGWNPSAVNPTSGASGIPQELGHTVPADYSTNAGVQIKWGLDYIHGRYGSPLNAWQHEQQFGWY